MPSRADDIYWDGGAGNWGNDGNWSIGAGLTTPNPDNHPGVLDIAHFSISTSTTADVNLIADQFALGLVIEATNTATTLLASNTGVLRSLTLGSQGIVVKSLAGTVTIGDIDKPMSVIMAAAQSWTNNSTNGLVIVNPVITGGYDLTSGGTGNTAIAGAIEGAGSLTKTGEGTLTLSGINSYTGLTTVSDGKLVVSSTGTISPASAIWIGGGEFNYNSATPLSQEVSFTGTGGKFSGSGTITPAVTILSGNTLAAGAVGDPGTRTFTGGVTLETGSIFSWDLDATNGLDPGVVANSGTYDKVTGNGHGSGIFEIVLGSNAFTDPFWDTAKTWNDIFSGSSPAFSVFLGAGVAPSGVVTGQGQFSYSSGTLIWSAVPEPTSALAGLLLAGGLLCRRRLHRVVG